MNRIRSSALLFIFCLILPLRYAHAQLWEPLNARGGDFIGTVTDPADSSSMRAITHQPNAAWESSDGGRNWTKLSDLPSTDTLLCMCAFDFSHLYVLARPVTTGWSVCYRSSDGGRTWQTALIGENVHPVQCCVDPTDANKIYATGFWFQPYTTEQARFFKSADGGVTWDLTAQPYGATDLAMGAIAISRTSPNVIYASGAYTSGTVNVCYILRTENAGTSWTKVFQSVGASNFASIPAIAVDPNDSQRVYASNGGIYRTDNGGQSWTRSPGADGDVIAIDPVNTSIIYVGATHYIYVSRDRGQTWTEPWSWTYAVRGYTQAIDIAPSDPAKVRVSTTLGLFGSADRGATWGSIYTGLYRANYPVFAFAPSDHSLLVTGGYMWPRYTFFSSTDFGANWTEKGCVNSDAFFDLLINPDNPNRMLALAENSMSLLTLAHSDDGGASWTADWDRPFMNGTVACLVQDPAHANIVYAGGGTAMLFGKSTDGGLNWTTRTLIADPVNHSGCLGVAVAPSDPNIIYAVGWQSFELYPIFGQYATPRVLRSNDGGTSWTEISGNLISFQPIIMNGVPITNYATVIAVHADPGVIFIGTSNGVYYTARGGQNWDSSWLALDFEKSRRNAPCICGVALDPAHGTIYAAAVYGGVWSGNLNAPSQPWRKISDGLPERLSWLKLDLASGTLYVGTYDNGIWRANVSAVSAASPVWSRYR